MDNSLSPLSFSPLNIISSDDNRKDLSAEEQKQLSQLNDQREFLATISKPAVLHAIDSRRRYDYEWMVREMFYRGYQFSRYQPATQTVIMASRQTARIPINILKAEMRSIANQATSFDPKYEVMPRYGTEESSVSARYSGRLLDYYHDHLGLKKKIKETLIQGLMFSVGGPWEIIYNDEKKEIDVWLLDPRDFLFDPLTEGNLDESEFCIKVTRVPLGSVIFNEDYNPLARREITGGESKLSISEYKQFMLQALRYVTQFNRQENPTILLYQGDFRIREEGRKPYLRRVIWTEQNSIPLLYEDQNTNEYDYVIYQADLNPKEIYGESWMKHVMPLNRAINSLESSQFDYHYKVAKGRIVVDKDSGVRAIHNVHGEIISKKRGSEVRAMDMPSLPSSYSMQIERLYKYMEDISGVHDSSLGRVPPGSRSGLMLSEMKASDATSQDDIVSNLEDFLVLVAKKMLKKISENYTSVKVIQDLGYREQDAKMFAVVGEKYKSSKKENKNKFRVGPDYVDLAVIGKDNNIRVTIGSWLGYTKDMMQEKTVKLLQLGAIDQKTFLRLWEFGNVDEIVQQTRIEKLLQNELQNPNDPKQVNPYIENDMMVLEGKPVMPDPHDKHLIHNMAHQEAMGKGNDDLVVNHMKAHELYYSSQKGSPISEERSQSDQQVPFQEGVNPQDALRNQQIQFQGMNAPSQVPTSGPPVMNLQSLQSQ